MGFPSDSQQEYSNHCHSTSLEPSPPSSSLLRATMAADSRYGKFTPTRESRVSPMHAVSRMHPGGSIHSMSGLRQRAQLHSPSQGISRPHRSTSDSSGNAEFGEVNSTSSYSDDVMWRILQPHPEKATLLSSSGYGNVHGYRHTTEDGDMDAFDDRRNMGTSPSAHRHWIQSQNQLSARRGESNANRSQWASALPLPSDGRSAGQAHRSRRDNYMFNERYDGDTLDRRGDRGGYIDGRGDAQWASATLGANEQQASAANTWQLPTYSPTSFVRAYVGGIGSGTLEATLHPEPALIVGGCTTAMSVVIGYFLQNHVLDTRDHIALFAVGTYIVFSSYYMIYYFLERYSTSFRKISQDKKFYTIGNLIKAGVLISITPFAVLHLTRMVLYNTWDANTLRNLGCIYAIPDFVSMIVVQRMAWSTWVHHLCVVVFNYFSVMNDYEQENVCRLVVVYAAFSTFAYCVNLLLASRFLGVTPRVARVLSFVALVVYVLCCAVNWTWQVYYLRRLLLNGHEHWTVYVYMMLICFVMWDDIVLNKWLLQNARNTSALAAASAAATRVSATAAAASASASASR